MHVGTVNSDKRDKDAAAAAPKWLQVEFTVRTLYPRATGQPYIRTPIVVFDYSSADPSHRVWFIEKDSGLPIAATPEEVGSVLLISTTATGAREYRQLDSNGQPRPDILPNDPHSRLIQGCDYEVTLVDLKMQQIIDTRTFSGVFPETIEKRGGTMTMPRIVGCPNNAVAAYLASLPRL
jgi:hypothetical protein